MATVLTHHPQQVTSNEPDKRAGSLNPQRRHKRSREDRETANLFHDIWRKVTDDNYLTLYGFRRFRTTHLLNLRYLEAEIDTLDHQIFQAGLKLGHIPTPVDKLGLQHGKIDPCASGNVEAMTRELVLKLRELIMQYGMLCLAMKHDSIADQPHAQTRR